MNVKAIKHPPAKNYAWFIKRHADQLDKDGERNGAWTLKRFSNKKK